uniref:SEA domain-containing protein n=1 Tax=Macrostomum lignano TaxID=282301 RepID=A0A1I8F6C9_9PLAT
MPLLVEGRRPLHKTFVTGLDQEHSALKSMLSNALLHNNRKCTFRVASGSFAKLLLEPGESTLAATASQADSRQLRALTPWSRRESEVRIPALNDVDVFFVPVLGAAIVSGCQFCSPSRASGIKKHFLPYCKSMHSNASNKRRVYKTVCLRSLIKIRDEAARPPLSALRPARQFASCAWSTSFRFLDWRFAGDAAAAGAQFSREFTHRTCSAIASRLKSFAKYTMTFSTAESSLFNQATVERVFNKGLLLFNAEFSGGHPMTSLSAWSLCPRPSAASLPKLAASIVAEAEAGGASPSDTTPVSSRLESPLPEAAEPLQQKPPSSGEVLLLGVGLGVVSAAGAVTAIAICLYLAWRLRSWRRNRQRLRMAAAPAEDTAAVNPRFQDDDSFSGAHLSLKSAKAPGSRQPQARLHRGSLSDSQRGSSSALLS